MEAKLAGMHQQLDSRQDAFCNLQGDLNAMEAHHKQVCKLFALHVCTILSLQVSIWLLASVVWCPVDMDA